MERKFDTNYILNDIYDNGDGVVRLRRFDSNYIWNAIYDPTLPGIRIKDMRELIAPDGYVYALKSDNSVCGKRISLGQNDSEDNWELVIESSVVINENNEPYLLPE